MRADTLERKYGGNAQLLVNLRKRDGANFGISDFDYERRSGKQTGVHERFNRQREHSILAPRLRCTAVFTIIPMRLIIKLRYNDASVSQVRDTRPNNISHVKSCIRAAISRVSERYRVDSSDYYRRA